VDLKMKQSLDRCSRLSSVHEQFKNLMVWCESDSKRRTIPI
jgi:hypothetical protein